MFSPAPPPIKASWSSFNSTMSDWFVSIFSTVRFSVFIVTPLGKDVFAGTAADQSELEFVQLNDVGLVRFDLFNCQVLGFHLHSLRQGCFRRHRRRSKRAGVRSTQRCRIGSFRSFQLSGSRFSSFTPLGKDVFAG